MHKMQETIQNADAEPEVSEFVQGGRIGKTGKLSRVLRTASSEKMSVGWHVWRVTYEHRT